MSIDRRTIIGATLIAAMSPIVRSAAEMGSRPMYGLIGKMNTKPGQRDALAAILLEGTAGMPGCLSYVIATDPGDVDALWITEVWDSEASHAASLTLPSVQEAIAKGRPMIAGFGERFVTAPIGGQGLAGR